MIKLFFKQIVFALRTFSEAFFFRFSLDFPIPFMWTNPEIINQNFTEMLQAKF